MVKEREDSSCQICHRIGGKRKDEGKDSVLRTKQESERKEMADLLVGRASAEKLKQTGPAKKEKKQSHLSRSPDREKGESR